MNIFRRSSEKSQNCIILKDSPTIAGADWGAIPSAIVRIAKKVFVRKPERKFRGSGTGMIRSTGEWIRWNYDRRLEIWDLNNRTTKSAGGPDCIWSGMNSGSVSGQSRSFRDL